MALDERLAADHRHGELSASAHRCGALGALAFEIDDGTEVDLGPGDAYAIPPGHDAWVVGDDPVRTIDWAPAHDPATEAAVDAVTS